MKLTLTRKKIKNIVNEITAISANQAINARLAYGLQKNNILLRDEVALIVEFEAKVLNAEWLSYENRRIDLCIAHAEKNSDGNPVTVEQGSNQSVYKIQDEKAFKQAIEKLNDECKEIITRHTATIADYNAFLDETVEVTLYPIKLALFDSLTTTSQTMETLFDLIEE